MKIEIDLPKNVIEYSNEIARRMDTTLDDLILELLIFEPMPPEVAPSEENTNNER